MSYPCDPCFKLTIISITALLNSHNHFNKSFLKDIFSQLFVTNDKENIGMNTTLISA